jgi:hypothetical protein
MQTRDPQRREFWREIERFNIAPTTGFLNKGLQGIEWVILRDHSGGKACG